MKHKARRPAPPPIAAAHLARSGGRWVWAFTCPVCAGAHDCDAGPVCGPPIVAPGLTSCGGKVVLLMPGCLSRPRCPGCPADAPGRN